MRWVTFIGRKDGWLVDDLRGWVAGYIYIQREVGLDGEMHDDVRRRLDHIMYWV